MHVERDPERAARSGSCLSTWWRPWAAGAAGVLAIAVVAVAMMHSAPATATTPALAYHSDSTGVVLTAPERAVAGRVEAILGSTRGGAPDLDLRLVDAARRLLSSHIQVRDALHTSGASDGYAVPLSFSVSDSANPVAAVEPVLRSEVGPLRATHYGVGALGGPDPQRIALVFVRRRADIGRFPKRFHVGEQYLLTGTLARGLDRPLVLLGTPHGRVLELQPHFEHGVFWAMVRMAHGAGRYGVEVQATGPHGVEVLNVLEVYASEAGAPLEVPVVRLSPRLLDVPTAELAEARAMLLVNRSRAHAGLPALSAAPRLLSAARAHSADMAEGGFFGHVSPTRGGLEKRLARAKLPARVLARENIAIAPHPDVAHSELLRSPSHMRNILDPDVSHVGVGVHRRETALQPVYTFTQIFARLE